jgi:hypothetical protein
MEAHEREEKKHKPLLSFFPALSLTSMYNKQKLPLLAWEEFLFEWAGACNMKTGITTAIRSACIFYSG